MLGSEPIQRKPRRGAPPSVVADEVRHLCIGSAQSTCPSSQHSTCLATKICPVSTANPKETTKGGPPLWRRPKAACCVGCEQWSFLSVETQDMCLVENHRGGRPKAASPLWWRPKAATFVLAVSTGHILVLRHKTCALLRAKTSALLRRKTCAV